MNRSIQLFIIVIIASVFIITGCDDPTNPFFRETDFSTVPDPIDYSNADPVEMENGIVYYIVEEGTTENNFTVQSRDALQIFMTLRVPDGKILQSTYANNRTDPENIAVSSMNTRGLQEGVIGMKEGETRVLIVPPELGFTNISSSSQLYQYRDDPLIYEVELIEIIQVN